MSLKTAPLTEAEQRVLKGEGQPGCALCEAAAKKLGVPLDRPEKRAPVQRPSW